MIGDQSGHITLREYLTAMIDNLEKKVDLVLALNKDALDKSELKLDERLKGMNEFREQLNEQSKSFITRREFEIVNKNRRDNVALAVSFIGVIIAIVAVIIKVTT